MISTKYLWAAALAILVSCTNSPKEIEPIATEPARQQIPFEHSHNHDDEVGMEDAWHTVVVKEVLQAEKYSYLRVAHGSKEMWIATLKAEYKPDETYRMKPGLLKTNFKSIEHNRTFEELYLVSEIYPETSSPTKVSGTDEIEEFEQPNNAPEGVLSISTIIKSPEKYAGKQVRVYGKVVKVNPNIMDRNWLHLDDGSAPEYDFVLTTQTQVPVGHEVAFEGTIAVNRDFGAGYTYAVIMENAKPIR